jgi:hypothetical protein
MNNARRYIVLLGCFWFGAVWGLAFFGLLGAAYWSETSFGEFLDRYQTLITGVFAVLAATGTIGAMMYQVAQQRDIEDERRRRRNNAARAALSLALSELCQYAKDCVTILADVRRTASVDRHTVMRVSLNQLTSFPIIPAGLVPVLRDCIESAELDAAAALSALPTALQIQDARVTSSVRHAALATDHLTVATSVRVNTHDLDGFIIDAADIYSRASTLLLYARGEPVTFRTKPTLENMKTTFFVCQILEDDIPTMWVTVRRRYSQGGSQV